MATHLVKLSLSNFRSFLGDHVVEFPRSGLILLKGESGAGKSTVFHAITYALGFNTIPVKDLQNWSDQSGPMTVCLELEHDGKKVEIVRTSKNSYLKVDGQTVSTSNKDFEKNLNKHLGLDSSFRELLTYRDQLNPVKFTKLADAEKKALLSELLGLKILEVALEDVSKDVSSLTAELERNQSVLQGMNAMLGERPEVTPSLPDRIKAVEVELDIIKSLEADEDTQRRLIAQEWHAEYRKQEDDLNRQIKEIPPVQVEVDDALRQNLRDLQTEEIRLLKEWDLEYRRLQELQLQTEEINRQNQDHLEDVKRIDEQIQSLKADECPTCRQPWDSKGLLTKLQKKKSDLEALLVPEAEDREQEAFDACVAHLGKRPSMAEQIDAARQVLSKAEAQVAVAHQVRKAKADTLKAQASQLSADFKMKTTRAQREPSQYEARRAQIVGELNRLRSTQKEETDRLNKWSDLLAKCQNQEAKVAIAEQALKIEQDWQLFLKGFLGRIFEEVLFEIASKANQILKDLPNTSTVTVDFQVQKASGKDSITPVYRFGGQEATLKAGASGGMATAIELAIDLALADTISTRKGASCNWILLDEAFNGFSQAVREQMLQILTAYARDRLVMAIDHAGEMQALFETVLEVTPGELKWSQ